MNAGLKPGDANTTLRVFCFPRDSLHTDTHGDQVTGHGALRAVSRARRLMHHLAGYARKLPAGAPIAARASHVERAYALHYVAREICASQGVKIQVSGGVIPERCVLVANHLSYIDPLAIARLGPTLAIAKAEVEDWPGIGSILERLGVLFVDRDDPHSGARVMKTALRALRQGARVLTFPEGTTSDGTQLLPFKLGAFALARLADVPVVPIAVRLAPELCWHGDAAFLPHYLRSVARPAMHVELEVGQALSPHPSLSDLALSNFIRADMAHMLSSAASCELCAAQSTHVEPLLRSFLPASHWSGSRPQRGAPDESTPAQNPRQDPQDDPTICP